jgi:hypothetical protein
MKIRIMHVFVFCYLFCCFIVLPVRAQSDEGLTKWECEQQASMLFNFGQEVLDGSNNVRHEAFMFICDELHEKVVFHGKVDRGIRIFIEAALEYNRKGEILSCLSNGAIDFLISEGGNDEGFLDLYNKVRSGGLILINANAFPKGVELVCNSSRLVMRFDNVNFLLYRKR